MCMKISSPYILPPPALNPGLGKNCHNIQNFLSLLEETIHCEATPLLGVSELGKE